MSSCTFVGCRNIVCFGGAEDLFGDVIFRLCSFVGKGVIIFFAIFHSVDKLLIIGNTFLDVWWFCWCSLGQGKK